MRKNKIVLGDFNNIFKTYAIYYGNISENLEYHKLLKGKQQGQRFKLALDIVELIPKTKKQVLGALSG